MGLKPSTYKDLVTVKALERNKKKGDRGSVVRYHGQGGLTMYLKRDRKTLTSGEVTYISLAHNIWEGQGRKEGQARPVVLLKLGVEAELDPEYADTLLVAAQAVFDRCMTKGKSVEEALDDVRKLLGTLEAPLKVLGSRELGMRLLLEPIWISLGLRDALRKCVGFYSKPRSRFWTRPRPAPDTGSTTRIKKKTEPLMKSRIPSILTFPLLVGGKSERRERFPNIYPHKLPIRL